MILRKCPTDGFDYTTIAAEKEYSADITELCKKIRLSLHDDGFNSHLFANSAKQYQFKGKDTEKNPYSLCLGNISKDFIPKNKENRIKWICLLF